VPEIQQRKKMSIVGRVTGVVGSAPDVRDEQHVTNMHTKKFAVKFIHTKINRAGESYLDRLSFYETEIKKFLK
jgi:hypothetical protein